MFTWSPGQSYAASVHSHPTPEVRSMGDGTELICSVVARAVLVQFQVQHQTGVLASNQLKLVHLGKTEAEETKTTGRAKAFPGYLPVSLSSVPMTDPYTWQK